MKNKKDVTKENTTIKNTEEIIESKSLTDRQKLILVDLICEKQISLIQKDSNNGNNREYIELEGIKVALKEMD